jgi:hypothetical protein
VSILIAPAGGAVHGPGGFGGGDDFIQPEETHQEDSDEWNSNQEVPPAGLQDDILHLRLQDAAVQRCSSVNFFNLLGYRPKLENIHNPR